MRMISSQFWLMILITIVMTMITLITLYQIYLRMNKKIQNKMMKPERRRKKSWEESLQSSLQTRIQRNPILKMVMKVKLSRLKRLYNPQALQYKKSSWRTTFISNLKMLKMITKPRRSLLPFWRNSKITWNKKSPKE